MVINQTSLYYKDGNSDKIYVVYLESFRSGYFVKFSYGRRGGTLKPGTKNSSPVSYDTAVKIFNDLIAEKMRKGYKPGTDTNVSQSVKFTTVDSRDTGVLPQLLNPVDAAYVDQLIIDPQWFMQEKFDGQRVLVRQENGQLSVINRKGQTIAIPDFLYALQESVIVDFILDGELIGDQYYVFDLLCHGKDLKDNPYATRLKELNNIFRSRPVSNVTVCETAKSSAEKRNFFNKLQSEGKEGVVLKNSTAAYRAGRPASLGNQLKHKFYDTCSCIVAKGREGKRSVGLTLLDNGKEVFVGNVTIGGTKPIPLTGSVIEVKYLYAYKGGSLYQPSYLGERTDIDREDCVIGQLKYKRE